MGLNSFRLSFEDTPTSFSPSSSWLHKADMREGLTKSSCALLGQCRRSFPVSFPRCSHTDLLATKPSILHYGRLGSLWSPAHTCRKESVQAWDRRRPRRCCPRLSVQAANDWLVVSSRSRKTHIDVGVMSDQKLFVITPVLVLGPPCAAKTPAVQGKLMR